MSAPLTNFGAPNTGQFPGVPTYDSEDPYSPWHILDADDCAAAYGSFHVGSPDTFGAAFRDGGLEVPSGRYQIARPVLFTDKRVFGQPGGEITWRLPCTFVPEPLGGADPWLTVAISNSGRGHLSDLTFDAYRRADHGIVAESYSLSALHNVEALRTLSHGIVLRYCQSTRMFSGLMARHTDGHGILVDSCNRMTGAAWNAHDTEGDGVHIIGGYVGPSPWTWTGGCSISGITAERTTGYGISVKNCLSPVVLGGLIWCEQNALGGVYIENATVVMPGSYVTGPTATTPAITLRNNARLYASAAVLGATDGKLDVDDSSRIFGDVSTWPGNESRISVGRTSDLRVIKRDEFRAPRTSQKKPVEDVEG